MSVLVHFNRETTTSELPLHNRLLRGHNSARGISGLLRQNGARRINGLLRLISMLEPKTINKNNGGSKLASF